MPFKVIFLGILLRYNFHTGILINKKKVDNAISKMNFGRR